MVWFCRFHILNYTWGVESHNSSLLSHVYPRRLVNFGKCGRRVLQSGIRAWFNTWTRWVECVCHACMKDVYVLVMYAQ